MPMSIISRYIIRQHIGPFFFGFSVITLIFILNLLFRELNRILSKGLPLNVVVEFFILNMGWIVALAAPMATLTASLMAFGRMSADNEIVALKASGISLYRLIAPALTAAALLAGFLIWFNNAVLPESNHRLAQLIRDISRKKPTINIEPGVWYNELSGYGLIVSDLKDSGDVSIAYNLIINNYSDLDITTTITAKKGYIRVLEEQGLLELLLFDGEMHEINIKKLEEFRRLRFPRHVVRIDITDRFLHRSRSSIRGDREKSAAMMRREVAEARKEMEAKKALINKLMGWHLKMFLGRSFGLPLPTASDSTAMRKTLQSFSSTRLPLLRKTRSAPASGNSDRDAKNKSNRQTAIHMQQLQALQQHRNLKSQVRANLNMIRSYKRRINSLSVEIHKKYSIPVACMVFILIGAPLGIMARSGGLGVGGGISLGFFLVYWASLIGGEDLADRGFLSPFFAMWGANILVGLGGVYLLIRSVRETTFIQFTWLRNRLSGLQNREPS